MPCVNAVPGAAGPGCPAWVDVPAGAHHYLNSLQHATATTALHEGSQESGESDAADMRLLSSQYFNQGVMNGYCGRHYQGFSRQSNSLIPVIVQVCCEARRRRRLLSGRCVATASHCSRLT